MHIQKLKASDIKAVLGEARREHKSKVGSIDESRTHLNYNLAPHDNIVHNAEELQQRIQSLGVKRKIQANAVLGVSTIVTLPKDYQGDNKAFFKAAYNALKDVMCDGQENRILQAQIHLDEAQPHMHFASIPIIEKDNKIKLSCRDLTTRSFMNTFHSKVQDYVQEELHDNTIELYNEELCKERKERKAKGDTSLEYTSIEEYKATKQKEAKNKEINADNIELIKLQQKAQEQLTNKQKDLNNTIEELGDIQYLKDQLFIIMNKQKRLKDVLHQLDTDNYTLINPYNQMIEIQDFLKHINTLDTTQDISNIIQELDDLDLDGVER